MKFKPYPKYQASGLEWLGEVPEGWLPTKLKHKTSFSTGWTPPTGDAASYLGENLWANISDLGEKVIHETSKRISDDAVKKANIVISSTGSLLFSFKLSIGQVSFVGNDMYTNEAIATFPPGKGIDVAYAYYAYPLFLVQNASENIYGAKLLNQSLINNADIVVPALAEQTTIASFLDRETAKIDTLIAKQEKLIDLLKEKRQAVISHAVTKGLDPDVPMKPSGVEWLGDVPGHWELPRISYVAEVRNGSTPDRSNPEYWGGAIPWLASGKVNDFIIESADEFVTQLALDATSLSWFPGGSVLVGLVGQGRTRGMCAMLTFPSCINQNVAGIVVGSIIDSTFLLHVLVAGYQSLRDFGRGGQQDALNCEILGAFRIPLPPLNEQRKIIEYLNLATTKIDTLIAKAQQAIALQKEHRIALISAAVTGKIDVREVVEHQCYEGLAA